jgi:hypothetical protein
MCTADPPGASLEDCGECIDINDRDEVVSGSTRSKNLFYTTKSVSG